MKPQQVIASSINSLMDAMATGDEDEIFEVASQVQTDLTDLLESDAFVAHAKVDESKARIKVKMDRGDSPRDQDSWTIEGQGETTEDALVRFDELMDRYINEYADQVREINPYE